MGIAFWSSSPFVAFVAVLGVWSIAFRQSSGDRVVTLAGFCALSAFVLSGLLRWRVRTSVDGFVSEFCWAVLFVLVLLMVLGFLLVALGGGVGLWLL